MPRRRPVIRPGPRSTWPGNRRPSSGSATVLDVTGSADLTTEFSIQATGNSPSQGSAEFTVEYDVAGRGLSEAAFFVSFSIQATGAALSRIVPVKVLTPGEILRGNRRTTYYLEILDGTDAPVARLDGVVDGKLDWVANAVVKGGGSLTVIDVNQSIDWLNARLRPVMLIDGLLPQPLGVFLASEAPESWTTMAGRKWSVKLLDKTTILDQDTIATTYAYPIGTVVTDAVVALIESAGITNHAITPSVKTLDGDLVWGPGTSKLRIINDLLDLINYFSLFSNFDGQMVGEPYTVPAQRPLMYEFLDGPESIYSSEFARDIDIWSIPNRVTLIGVGDGTTAALTSTIDNNLPDSPYSIANRGRIIGHTESGIEAADQATLDALARTKLINLTSPTAGLEISHAPVPGLAVNQATQFRRQIAGIDFRHVVSRTSITLRGNALATTTLRQVVDL